MFGGSFVDDLFQDIDEFRDFRARYIPEFGARELKRKIQTEIETPLAREILSGNIAAGNAILVDFEKQSNKMIFTEQ